MPIILPLSTSNDRAWEAVPFDQPLPDIDEAAGETRDAMLGVGQMLPLPSTAARPRPLDLRTATASIIGFWLFYFFIVTLRGLVIGYDDQMAMLGRRMVVSVVGMALTFGLMWTLRPFAARTLKARVAASALLVIPFATMFSSFNYAAFYVYEPIGASKPEQAERADQAAAPMPRNRWGEHDMKNPQVIIADGAVSWYFFFAAWAALYLALCYAQEVRAAERRAAAYRAAARDAEIRALRYQVNPHFLFNTLNSLSTLVMRDKPEEAERMILNLATFFRTSLTAGAADDLTLDEELRLQRLYLDIEAIRFPDRLRVAVDVAPGLGDACVPGLLLQPLIENAIKHGVSRVARPVNLTIRIAEPLPGRLEIRVEDDGPSSDPTVADTLFEPAQGTGTGLKNVAGRLAARYGEDASMHWGPRAVEGFGVVVQLPLVRNGC